MKAKFEVEEGIPYLDNAVTTPVRGDVMEAMLPYLQEKFADPDEPYEPGQQAAEALHDFRAQIAEMAGAKFANVWFTSGGTESNNWVMTCVDEHTHVAAADVEHLSVQRHASTTLAVNGQGEIEVDAVRQAIAAGTTMVSVQHANQETGIIQDVAAIAEVCQEAGVPLHVDAAMSFGVIPVDLLDLGANFLTLSSHKVWGPVGTGALVSDGAYGISPLLVGGEQEMGMRAGPVNLPAVAGFAAAVEILRTSQREWEAVERLRNRIETELGDILKVQIAGADANRLPNMTCMTFPGCDAAFMAAEMERCGGVCVGVGGAGEHGTASRVLAALGYDRSQRESSIRMRFPPWLTAQEADQVIVGVSSALREEQSRPVV